MAVQQNPEGINFCHNLEPPLMPVSGTALKKLNASLIVVLWQVLQVLKENLHWGAKLTAGKRSPSLLPMLEMCVTSSTCRVLAAPHEFAVAL